MIHAAEAPFKTAQTALKVLELAQIAAEKGNPNAASDAGVAALLAWAAVEGAVFNVKADLAVIKDVKVSQSLEAKITTLTPETRSRLRKVLNNPTFI